MPRQHRARRALIPLMVGLLWVTLSATAQQVYRIVGPDGKVTFSDQPPVDARGKRASTLGQDSATDRPSANPALPYELRNVVARYPATLYTGKECGPCNAARDYLNRRGVPFTEKTITSPADIAALKALGDDGSLPFATVGQQQLKGFSELEWGQYLNAAGYPATSQLPAGYRNPQATPLVALTPAAPQASAPRRTTPTTPAAPPPEAAPDPSNPAGIRF